MANETNEYWRQRELRHIQENIRNDEQIARRLRRLHLRAMENIENEIEAFYGRYATFEGLTMEEARKRVTRLDIERYERKARRYVREFDFTEIANEEMRLYNVTMRINRLQLLKANIHLELLAMTSEEQRILYEVMTESARAEYERLSGILGQTLTYNEQMLATIVNASFLSATWSDRLWDNQDALRHELDRLLNRGIVQGINPRQLARELREKFESSIYNSERLLRTELGRLQIQVQEDSYKQADISQYEVVVEPDGCDYCQSFDGKVFDVEDMEVSVNAPIFHPNCRCSTSAYISRETFEKDLEARGL